MTVKLNGTYNIDVFDPIVGTGAISHAQGVSSIDVQLTTDPLIVEITPTGGTAASASSPSLSASERCDEAADEPSGNVSSRMVIGSGPAGEKGAAQAAYFQKSVALVEREAMRRCDARERAM